MGGLPGLGWREEDPAEEVIRRGIVTAAHALSADGGFACYPLTIEPPIALLRHVRKAASFRTSASPTS
jgi:type VI secretion system secreted protein VgrG